MADATIALSPSAGRVAVCNDLAAIKAVITATATVYATASGGLPVDLFSILRTASPSQSAPINSKDVLDVRGTTAAGGNVHTWTAGTPTVSTAPGFVRIFNGATEQADGAVTTTMPVMIFIARGGAN